MSALIKNPIFSSVIASFVGMTLLVFLYWLVLFLVTGSILHPLEQFVAFKYWMSALILGFGIQIGLFWFIRKGAHLPASASGTALAAGTGTSTAAMIACCVHHVADFVPLLGIPAAALFVSTYQTYFFLIGILSNIAGISLMLYMLKTKRCPSLFAPFKRKLGK